MKISSNYMGISRQIVLIVLLIVVFITAGLSIVISVSSFNNLASITLDELDRMSKIFASQIHELQQDAVKSIAGMEANPLLSEQLEQLVSLGPYYYSDESAVGINIEESDKIYFLKAQIEIVQLLTSMKATNKLSSVSLYSLSPFNVIPNAEPVLTMRMDSEGIWVGKFDVKGEVGRRSYYYIANEDYRLPGSDLFDVSSIYQFTVKDFYQRFQLERGLTRYFDEILSGTNLDEFIGSEQTLSKIIVKEGTPFIRTWSTLRVPVSNPQTWESESVPAMLVVLEQELGADALLATKRQLGVDIALANNQEILVSSLGSVEQLKRLGEGQTIEASTQSFYYAIQNLEFDSQGGLGGQKVSYSLDKLAHEEEITIQAVVLSPISILAELTQTLFVQMTLLGVFATLLASLALYWAIRRLVNHPLNQLMKGVEKISAGELAHKVKVHSKNEFGQLALAFNEMSSELGKKTDELQTYTGSLEEMVEQRTSKLRSAQKQLIESEKMASLGELVAGVAHEINTPVGVGVTAASFLNDEAKGINRKYLDNQMTKEDFDAYLKCSLQTTDMILSNLRRATELVKSFKQVAVDQTAEERRIFLVKGYIEEVLVTLNPRIKRTQHTIEVTGDEMIEIDSYPGAFSQIITNLIMNSIIHAFTEGVSGRVTINVVSEEGQLVLTYTDDGIGIDEENLAKIFNPFFTTKRGYGGTGLGMHIVYNLVTQKLKGLIECHSDIGEGIQFTLTLPLAVDR